MALSFVEHGMDDGGWAASAEAWIAVQGEGGDWGRRFVLDAPMLARACGARRALDAGCGEGRFCRLLAAEGTDAVGVDPVPALLARAWGATTARAARRPCRWRTGRSTSW